MTITNRHSKFITIILLLVQLCLPLSGSLYISTIDSASEAGHTGIICAHTDVDAGNESQGGHQQVPYCHELDAPCDTASSTVVKHSPIISTLTASYNGAFKPGYGAPPEIPPKISV